MRHDRRKPLCLKCGQPKPKGQGRKLCDTCERVPKARTGCRDCGGPRPPRKQLCDDCRELCEWRRKARARNRKRRACSDCGGPKGPGKRRRFCDRCTAKRATPRPCENCKQRPKRYSTAKLCTVCKFEAVQRVRERNRLRHHQYREQVKTKPRKISRARRKAINEDHRMSKRLRAERAGAPIAPLDADAYQRRYGLGARSDRVPVHPIAPLLAELDDPQGFAEGAGVSVSAVYRIINGQYTHLRTAEADRIYAQLGMPISYVLGAA